MEDPGNEETIPTKILKEEESSSITTTTTTNDATKTKEIKEEEEEKDDDKPRRDDEGLLLEGYDVIVCGTGLVQSIVASALARAGKSVLHIDGANHYGELDAVWNLSFLSKQQQSFNETTTAAPPQSSSSSLPPTAIPLGSLSTSSLKWHSQTNQSTTTTSLIGSSSSICSIQIGTHVQTPYGIGRVQALFNDDDNHQHRLEVSLDSWKLANGTSPMVYFGTTTTTPTTYNNNNNNVDDDPRMRRRTTTTTTLEERLFQQEGIRSLRSIQAETFLKDTRHFALDATPAFILAAGRAVEGMLASGVADYLEFKPIDGLYWLDHDDDANNNNKNNLSRVPCNKNDVFGTKLLKPMDKRRLMKFIQLSMDYATQMSVAEEIMLSRQKEEEDSTTTTTTTSVSPETQVQSLNERHLNQGRSLARPQNKAVATEELQVLSKCMEQHDISFDDFLSQQHKLSPKLRAIVRYALALETTPTSTSLSQGMSSLRRHLQALGRYGTTAFLVPMYGSGELSQAFCRSAAVFGATYLLRRAPMGIDVVGTIIDNDNHNHKVTGIFVAGEVPLEDDNDNDDDDQRYYTNETSQHDKKIPCSHVVVPVGALPQKRNVDSRKRILRRISILNGKLISSESGDQRHVIVIPPQHPSIGNSHAIQCVTLDDSVQVAPRGCTLLHLTTTVLLDDESNWNEVLEKAFQSVLAAKQTTEIVDEIYQVTFSHPLSSRDDVDTTSLPHGVHVCSHSGQVLTADVAFEQAQKIFSAICPGMEFLGLSDELDATIKERAVERGYEDDERLMLESALGMIGATPETSCKEEEGEPTTGSNEIQEPKKETV